MKKDILIQIESKKIEISSCEEIANLYNERLNNKSLDDLEVMLMTETYQNQAFNLVSDLLKNISSCESIFDIGCGYGCLLKFLREKWYKWYYYWIDLVPDFIEKAKKRFQNDDAVTFRVGDFLDMGG